MHKKLEAELVSLAHQILQMKNKDEVVALRNKAHDVYEKLAVLAFVNEYIDTTPNFTMPKEELTRKIEKIVATQETNEVIETQKEQASDKEESIFEPKFDSVKIDIGSLKPNQISSKEEFRDAISADKTSTLFDDDNLSRNEKKTLNDKLVKKAIQIGLNDRIAFVNNLFRHNQSDFDHVLSQLNTFKTEKEAKDYIEKKVKPDYNWQNKETYEERLIALIERKFL